MIDPNKQYRTRDGRPVRIYATDGASWNRNCPTVHGAVLTEKGWESRAWNCRGVNEDGAEAALIEVTLADELTEQIPWEVLHPEIRWVAMRSDGLWYAFYGKKPEPEDGNWRDYSKRWVRACDVIVFPIADIDRWRETLCKRPEGR